MKAGLRRMADRAEVLEWPKSLSCISCLCLASCSRRSACASAAMSGGMTASTLSSMSSSTERRSSEGSVWMKVTGSMGASELVAWASSRRCCSARCCASTSSWMAGGSAARNSGLTSVSPGVATTGGAGLGAGGARAGGRMPSWFCSTSRRMSSGSAARNEGSTPSGRLIPASGSSSSELVEGSGSSRIPLESEPEMAAAESRVEGLSEDEAGGELSSVGWAASGGPGGAGGGP